MLARSGAQPDYNKVDTFDATTQAEALQYFAGDFKRTIPNLRHCCRLIDIAESFTKTPISTQGNKERNRERESEILFWAPIF